MKRMIPAILAVLFFVTCIPADAEDGNPDNGNSTAVQVVEGLHGLLIQCMKSGHGTTCSERYALLAQYVQKSFDFPLISRIVLSRRNWKALDSEKQQAFIRAFSEMTAAIYARRFDSYSGERFKTIGARLDERGHYVVDTVLIKRGGDEISFRYVCRRIGAQWKIVSVSAKGVNDLSVKRADYTAFLKDHSIDDLIARLKDQAGLCLGPRLNH